MENKNKILIDASHSEETRVVVLNDGEISEYEFEVPTKKELKGNIYLAKITRVEASLQAAFVDYGAKKQGFLPFSEISINNFNISKEDLEEIKRKQTDYRESLKSKLRSKKNKPSKENINKINAVTDHNNTISNSNSNNIINNIDSENITNNSINNNIVDSNTVDNSNSTKLENPLLLEQKSTDILEPLYQGSPENKSNITKSETENQEVFEEIEEDDDFIDDEELLAQMEKENLSYGNRFGYKIQDVIKANQYILVQVIKEERGNKGVSLTTYISIPGKYCVLIPNSTTEGGGISKKINNYHDRQRLKKLLTTLDIPINTNVIMRTACIDKSDEQIIQDHNYISNVWAIIQKQLNHSKKPCLLFEDGSLIKKVIRDLYSGDINEIVIEGKKAYDSAINFAKSIAPDIVKKITKFNHPKLSLFKYYNVEESVKNIYSPVVFLKSGGYIVINPTEALVTIDVNSGKVKGKRNVEETAIKTNMDAAIEIMQQIKLRDIGGLIVIDFIDMENPKNKAMVEKKVKDLAKLDKAKLQVSSLSTFGLLELSRQRLKASILERSFSVCPKCQGLGHVRPLELNALQILKNIENDVSNNKIHSHSSNIILKMPTEEAFYLLNNKRIELNKLENILQTSINIECEDGIEFPFYYFEEPKKETENEISSFLETELENNRVLLENNKTIINNPKKKFKDSKKDKKNNNNKLDKKSTGSWLSKLLKF